MTLQEYDAKIKPNLDFIEAGSEMAARYARDLIAKPDFETLAENELRQARNTLAVALASLDRALADYEAKPLESSHAA